MRFICPICLKRMIFFYKKTPCGHKFHHKCLKNWKAKNNTCPSCPKELFNYKGTYHQQDNISLNLKHNNNSILITNCNTNKSYPPIKYSDIPHIQHTHNTLIITQVIRDENGRRPISKYITTPHATDIFRQLIQIFYECHNKLKNIKEPIDVDSIINQTKVYTFEESYDLMPVRTIRVN